MISNVSQTPTVQKTQSEIKKDAQAPQQPSVGQQTPPPPAGGLTPTTKPKKKLKLIISIIVLILIAFVVGGFFVWRYFSTSKTSVPLVDKIVNQKKEEEVSIYKGVWMPTLYFQDENYIELNTQRLKDIGINTIFIQGSPPQPEQWLGKIEDNLSSEIFEQLREILPVEKELIIKITEQAHRNGFKVAFTMSNLPDMEGVDMDLLNSRIVEYALLAEEYDIELFAPMNEPEVILGENTGKWKQEILAKIKAVYHGDVLWKGAGVDMQDKSTIASIADQPPGDYVGYDYIGFSTLLMPKEVLEPHEQIRFADQSTLEVYPNYIEAALDYKLAQAKRDGCKGVILSEFGVLHKGSLSEEEIARAYEIVLERGKDRVVGFIAMNFLGAELPGMPPVEEYIKTTEVIKEWFTEVLPEKKWISY
jgi:hypothetical protein